MLDIKFIRENPKLIKEALKYKRSKVDLVRFFDLDQRRRQFLQEIEALRAEQNKINDSISLSIKEAKDPSEYIGRLKGISAQISDLEVQFKEVRREFNFMLLSIPNVAHPSVPLGDASKNKVLRQEGSVPKFDFTPLDHMSIAENLDIIDFQRAVKVSGRNFVFFKGKGALLERALLNFMLDLHIQKHGYKEIFPPYLVSRDSMTATGQLPKMEEDMYKTTEDDLFLIPTAEVPLTNIHRGEVLDAEDLPLCYTAFTSCFRREAGSYGKDTRGLVRVHQFDKVEMVKFTLPQDSYKELDKLVNDAEDVLRALELPYRVVELAYGDLSFAAAKCYDLEVFSVGISRWLEVSSCSNFEDFQARRGNIRFKDKHNGKTSFVHTLNGSGLALARIVVAILENFQDKDGNVVVPKALRSYMNGTEIICRE